MTPLAEQVFEQIAEFFSEDAPARVGVAVSGGGDSLALMLLLADWARSTGATVVAATVDHGLRSESGQEAGFVGQVAHEQNIDHRILRWEGWSGQGNLQDAARRARYQLLTEWAKDEALEVVALAHTLDDQAETFVMRLARSAGVDGLSGMSERRRQDSVVFVRPLLGVTREELRRYLRGRQQEWVDDPSNEDRRFERIRVRDALGVMNGLGISAEVLSTVAGNLASAAEALDWQAYVEARSHVKVDRGDVIICRKGWRSLHDEVARRILRAALLWIGGADYPPRREKLKNVLSAIGEGATVTLAGSLIRVEPETIRLSREPKAVEKLITATNQIWDRRWRILGPVEEGAEVRMLGEKGLAQCPEWRESGLPYTSLLAAPAIWIADTLVAAPLVQANLGWKAELRGGEDEFFTTLLPRGK